MRVDLEPRPLRSWSPARCGGGRFLWRDAVAVQQVVQEGPVLRRDHVPQRGPVLAAALGSDELPRHQQVDAIRQPVGLLVYPGQIGLELLGRVRDRPQHAEATRAGDRGDHVTAVREGEDRILHLEHLGDRRLHQHSSLTSGSTQT
jgi:hypothetical protein